MEHPLLQVSKVIKSGETDLETMWQSIMEILKKRKVELKDWHNIVNSEGKTIMHIIADQIEQKVIFGIFEKVMWRISGYAIIYNEQRQNISNAMLEIWCKQDKNGRTPAHLLWATKNSDIIKEAEHLIGFDTNNAKEAMDTIMGIKDNEGRTPDHKPIQAPPGEAEYGLTLCLTGIRRDVKEKGITEESKDGLSSKAGSSMNQAESFVTKLKNVSGENLPPKGLLKTAL